MKLRKTMKAQRPKRRKNKEKKFLKERERERERENPNLGYERDPHHPGSRSFERKPKRSLKGCGQSRRPKGEHG